ncbi:hypothetical protein RhiirC2_797136 [Rhizophagus irregularis]|uniref:Uncharacterized protein n=1 Tax=Rhizophagus irregularis TaxID=588596 RepID=A0A2N1M8H9_9GLOM|nr:hypothetical protein RhiirC2_797136 [Rhizophagus irregularis]
MNLDSKVYFKLIHAYNSVRGSEEYIRIIVTIISLAERHNHETPEMWCSRIRNLFRKLLEENPRILSKNGYITMYEKLYVDDRIHNRPTNYIYCSVYDSLIFTPANGRFEDHYGDNHLKRCISKNPISNEHARINEKLQSIDSKKFSIWQHKQSILREEAKLKCFRLELFFQSTSHSEKDKLASVSYNYDTHTILYKAYVQVKTTIAKNTMPRQPSAPNFESAYISPAKQEMIPLTSYHVFFLIYKKAINVLFAYSDLLAKLPAFLINEAWIRLTSQKRKLLSEKEASEINPIVELFLKYEAIKD